MKKIVNLFLAPILAICLANVEAFAGGGHDHGHSHAHDEHEQKEEAQGPHGGKLLVDGDFSLELTIFEKGAPPHFRVYAFHDKHPLVPSEVSASIELTRFGGKKDSFQLLPAGEYLSVDKVVAEPHSFDASVSARYDGKEFQWSYSSYEGRTQLSDAALEVAKLRIETAAAAQIFSTVRVYGRLIPNENKVAHVVPRFPGIVKEIRKSLGDSVEKGETLAIVESNQSLQPYEIRSQVAGKVVMRHATLGEYVSDDHEIFVVADLSELWADFQVYRDDFGPIESGQKITVDLGSGEEIPATLTYVSPLTDEVTQSKLVRAVLQNASGLLKPGLFISGSLSGSQSTAAVAVKREAIQTFRDWDVVYVTDGHVFQAMPVTLGRKDSKYVEVLSGLAAGDKYVSTNSFVIKADIEKSGASHDH